MQATTIPEIFTNFYIYKISSTFLWLNIVNMFENINKLKLQEETINSYRINENYSIDKQKFIIFEVNDSIRKVFYTVAIEMVSSTLEAKVIVKAAIKIRNQELMLESFIDDKTIDNYLSNLDSIEIDKDDKIVHIESIFIKSSKQQLFSFLIEINKFFAFALKIFSKIEMIKITESGIGNIYKATMPDGIQYFEYEITDLKKDENNNMWFFHLIKTSFESDLPITREVSFEVHEITKQESFLVIKHYFEGIISINNLNLLSIDKKKLLRDLKANFEAN